MRRKSGNLLGVTSAWDKHRIAPRKRSLAGALALCLVSMCMLAGCGATEPRLHLFLISVDTLRADRLGTYGNPHGLTPNLDAFAKTSLVFDRAYAPSSITLPSVSAILTGQYPTRNGIFKNKSVLPLGVPTLATELRSRGWHTAAVVSNYVLRRISGLETGFDIYDDRLPQVEANRPGAPERIADSTTDDALTALDTLMAKPKRSMFLWVHYQDPHGPYTPPAGLRERYLEIERQMPDGRRQLPSSSSDFVTGAIPNYQQINGEHEVAYYRAGYNGEIHHMDREVGRLLDGITERGLMDKAVIVFASDHGEGLGEDDYWFAHGEYLTDPLVRVPLLIWIPGRSAARRSDVVGLVDLYPTLLALAGAELNEDYPGRDLLAPDASQKTSVVYLAAVGGSNHMRIGLVAREHMYLLTVLEDQSVEQQLYRLGDPHQDLSTREPDLARSLGDQLSGIARTMLPTEPAQEQELSPADRERLRALGYAGD